MGHRVLGKCSTPTLTPLIERVKTRSGVGRREKLDHFDTIGSTRRTNAGTRITHTRARLLGERTHSGAQITKVGKMLFLFHLTFQEKTQEIRNMRSKINFQLKVKSLLYKLSVFGLTKKIRHRKD